MTGGYISCKITPFRIVIGAWCLLTLVLINAYNGVLISYVTTTHQTPPLINSIEDVASKSNIHIVVNKGQGPDTVTFSVILRTIFMFLTVCLFNNVKTFNRRQQLDCTKR